MKWLIYGILASILFGLWGLFDKLSSSINPFASNLVLYMTAFLIATFMLLFTRKIKFSKNSILSGIFAGIGNFFVLYALLNNLLILVLPFVSLAGAAFFVIVYLKEKPKYTKKQKILSFLGLSLSVLGMFLISVSSTGISNFLKGFSIDKPYIFSALFILLGFTLWTYFTYKSVAKEKITALNYNFWTNTASLFVAIIAITVLNSSSLEVMTSFTFKGYIYPILAGACVSLGTFFTYNAFKNTTTKTKLQEVIVGILANGEVIPLLFFSYFILREWALLGFLGTFIVLIGLILIHYAEVSK